MVWAEIREALSSFGQRIRRALGLKAEAAAALETEYNRLHFYGLYLNPGTRILDVFFRCPECKTGEWTGSAPLGTAEINTQIAFPIPAHGCVADGRKIRLFVAKHQEAGKDPLICVQRSDAEGASGIRADWWMVEI